MFAIHPGCSLQERRENSASPFCIASEWDFEERLHVLNDTRSPIGDVRCSMSERFSASGRVPRPPCLCCVSGRGQGATILLWRVFYFLLSWLRFPTEYQTWLNDTTTLTNTNFPVSCYFWFQRLFLSIFCLQGSRLFLNLFQLEIK